MSDDTIKHNASAAPRPSMTAEVSTTSQSTDEAVIALARKMGRAAGKVPPKMMAEACYILICTACIATDASRFADFLARKQESRRKRDQSQKSAA